MANRLSLPVKDALAMDRGLRSARAGAIFTITHALFLSKDVWVQNILAFLAARAAVLGNLHPFGAAYFLAVLVGGARHRAVAAALSVVAGSMTALPTHRTFALAVWTVVALAITRGAPSTRKSAAAWRQTLLLSALYAASRAVPGWLYSMTLHESVSIAVETVLMVISAVLLMPVSGFRWSAGVQRFERSTMIALGLLASVAGLGLLSIEWLWVQPAEVWFRWMAMFAALIGAGGGGAATGTFLDVLVSLMARLPLGGLGLYGVGGLFGGLMARRGKAGVVCGFALGQMLVSVHTDGADEIILGAVHTLMAAGLLWITPRRWAARFSRALPGSEPRSTYELTREKRLREAITSRLRDVGSVFHELADVFAGPEARSVEPAARQGDLNALVERVWHGQCRGCSGFEACWQESFYRSYWDMVDLVAIADQNRGSITRKDLPAGLGSRCFQQEEFVACFNAALTGKVRTHRARRDSLDLVPQQLRGVAELIESTADQVRLDTGRAEELEAHLREELELRRIDVDDVRVIHAAYHPEVEIAYQGGCDGCGRCVQILTPVAERVLGDRYSGTSTCRGDEEGVCRVLLAPEPPFELKVEVARLAKDGGTVSGDSLLRLDLGGGRVSADAQRRHGCGRPGSD